MSDTIGHTHRLTLNEAKAAVADGLAKGLLSIRTDGRVPTPAKKQGLRTLDLPCGCSINRTSGSRKWCVMHQDKLAGMVRHP